MAYVKWIKIVTDIFDDEKVLIIENMPEADSIIVIWFKLLCLAGKSNNGGVFLMNNRIAYTDEMLAAIFRRPLNTVRLALKTFEDLGMIELINNAVTIPNWEKHQSLDAYERKKERDKIYQQKKREKQRLLANEGIKSDDYQTTVDRLSDDCQTTVGRLSDDCPTTVASLEREEEIEKELDNNIISKDIICCTFIQRLIEKWNSLNLSTKLTKITVGTNRYKMLRARIKNYSEEEILNAVDEVRKSKFLIGQATDFEITFDWFIKPNNFLKVLEGNYRDKEGDKVGRNTRKDNEESEGKKPDFTCFE